MKSLRLILIMASILMWCAGALADIEYKVTTETYKGNTYEIKDYGSTYAVNNKKYVYPKEDRTPAIPNEGEDINFFAMRVRPLKDEIDNVMYSVFTTEEVAYIKSHDGITNTLYWDTETSDYIGVAHLAISKKLRDVITVKKVYEIEQALKKAHLNAGSQNLRDPDRKYFAL